MPRTAFVAGACALIVAQGCWLVSSLGDLPVEGDAGPDHAAPRDASGVRDRSSGEAAEPEGGLAEAGGASLCPKSGDVFCDGFEHGLAAWSPYMKGGGEVTVDATHVFRGAHALHVSLPATTMTTAVLEAILYRLQARPGAASPLYERVFAYFTETPTVSTSLLTLNAPAEGGAVGYLRAGGDVALLTFGVPGAKSLGSSSPIPTDRWTCLEMEVDGTTARFWVDGEAVSLALPLPLPTVEVAMQVGVFVSQIGVSTPKFEAWFDEVAANGARVGCVE